MAAIETLRRWIGSDGNYGKNESYVNNENYGLENIIPIIPINPMRAARSVSSLASASGCDEIN